MADVWPPTDASPVEFQVVAQRASDLERQAVVDHLRAATSAGRLSLDEFEERVGIVLGARTREELAPVTADLPAVVRPANPQRGEQAYDREGKPGRRRRIVSAFASTRHEGVWEPDAEMTVVALFGHSHIDLAACPLPASMTSIELRTFNVFAGIEVVVPAGAVVDIAGFTIFGGRQLRHRSVESTEAGLRVTIQSYGAFGGVLVRSARRVP
jgi:hypothetical protein